MKKFLLLLLALSMLMLSACSKGGETTEPTNEPEPTVVDEHEGLKLFSHDSGFNVWLPEEAQETPIDGFDVAYVTDHFFVSAIRESVDYLEELGIAMEDFDIDDYTDAIIASNNNKISFEKGPDGWPFARYISTVENTKYSYHSVLRAGSDAFWTITFGCLTDEESTYYPLFEKWAQMIEVDGLSNSGNHQIEDNTSGKNNEGPKTTYSVGDVLQDGDTKIVYISSGDYQEDNQYLQPSDGNKYIYLKFAFINEGKSDTTISFYSFDAYADGYACDMYYGSDESLSATLSAGRSTSGTIVFEVPSNAENIEIEYSPNGFSSKKIIFVFEGEKDSGYVLESNTSRTDGAYNVGDVIEGRNVKITYLSCEPYISDNMFIKPKDGYKYISLELEFENTGSNDRIISSFSFDCYADGVACESLYYRDDTLSGTISAGRKIKGTVTFEVPNNAEVIEVEYDDSIWTSRRIVFTAK